MRLVSMLTRDKNSRHSPIIYRPQQELDKYSTFVCKQFDMDCMQFNSPENFGSNEYKLSKKQKRVVQKQMKLRNTLARHENIVCSESATRV